MTKGSSLNGKETIKEKTLELQNRRKNMVSKNRGKYNNFPHPLEFSKLCLITETKIITLSNVVLNVYRRHI